MGCSSVEPIVKRSPTAKQSNFIVWTEDLRSNFQKNSYNIVLKMRDRSIPGICVLKKNGDKWLGTLINEMGATIFDFTITDDKCELSNVFFIMDKWYIKKTIAADLYFLFNVDNLKATFQKRLERFEQDGIKVANYQKRQIIVKSDSVFMINRQRILQYELTKLIDIESDNK